MIVIIIGLCLFLYYLWYQRQFYYLYWKLSGPLGLPLLGEVLKIRSPERTFYYMTKIKNNYKSPLVTWLGPKCVLVASDADTMEELLTSPNFVNKSFVYEFIALFVGDGLFTSNVPKWNFRRKLIKPTFNRKILTSFVPKFNITLDDFIKDMNLNRNNENYDMYYNLKAMSLNVACQTTVGTKLELDCKQLLADYTTLMHAIISRMFKPWYFNTEIYKLTSDYKNTMIAAKAIVDFIENLVNIRNKQKETNDPALIDTKYSLLDQLLDNRSVHNLSLLDILEESNVMLAASFETTSTAIFIVIILLAMYPEYQEKLFIELKSIFPTKDFVVTEDDFKNMIYTEMVINEGMRLISPVPVTSRLAIDDYKLNIGVKIPKGTTIMLDIYNLQQREEYWGSDAKTFNPEHFSPENYKNVHSYAYVPFTKGNRMCIGFQYAMIFMKITIAKLFRNYKITTDTKLEELHLINYVSTKFKVNPHLKFEPRLV